jgi:predicted 3-demethylubiquinone-9 3-methyltransferase (glyoxalase superfamily)
MGVTMQTITPFLWFDNQAEEAAKFYCSIFKNSKIVKTSRYNADSGPWAKGGVMTVQFELDGQRFIALNGGPQFKFTEAISLTVSCKDQKEVDHYWDGLLAGGGQESMCGWLKDRYGLSWQVNADALGEMLADKDANKAKRVMQAMMQMRKMDIRKLKEAYDG